MRVRGLRAVYTDTKVSVYTALYSFIHSFIHFYARQHSAYMLYVARPSVRLSDGCIIENG